MAWRRMQSCREFTVGFSFCTRAAFLRLRTNNGFGRGAPLISAFWILARDRAQVRFEIFEAHRCQLLAVGRLRHWFLLLCRTH